MPKILAFDTATAACSVALSVDGEIYEQCHVAPQQHASLILPMVQHLLTEVKMTVKDLDAIAFGCGPGSFMGIRIAAGVAQGLAFAAEKPVIAVSTLQVLAQTAYQIGGTPHILAGWDARMGEIYWGAYQSDEQGLMQSVQSDRLDEPANIEPPFAAAWLAVGNAWLVYANDLSPAMGLNPAADIGYWVVPNLRANFLRSDLYPVGLPRQSVAPSPQGATYGHATADSIVIHDVYPRAHALVRLAIAEFQHGNVLSPEEALPVYLRNKVARKPG